MKTPEDEELLALIAARRDREAFAEFFRRHEQAAFNLALHLTKNREEAADVLQESLVRLWKHAASYRSEGTARSWFLRIVARESLRRLRRERKDRSEMEAQGIAERPDTEHSPVLDAERAETLGELRKLLERLPGFERRLLALHFGGGLSQEEIGTELSLTQQAVSARIKKAMERLRAGLAQAGLAASLPMLDTARLGEAFWSGHSIPPGLAEKALAGLAEAGRQSVRKAVVGKTAAHSASSGAIVAVVCGLAVAASGIWWAAQTPSTSPRTAKPASAPEPVASPTKQAPPKPETIYRRWTFEKGAPTDLEVVGGIWEWKPAAGGRPAFMSSPPRSYLHLLLPMKIPAGPLLLTVKGRTVRGTQIVGGQPYWNDGHRAAPCRVWVAGGSLDNPQGTIALRYYLIDRWVVSYFGDVLWAFQEYEKDHPRDYLMFGTRSYDLEELEVRSLKPEEVPAALRNPQNFDKKTLKGPTESGGKPLRPPPPAPEQ